MDKKSIEQAMAEAAAEGWSGLAASVGKPDWQYKDIPRINPTYMRDFIRIMGGPGEMVWVAATEYPDGSIRGQMLISPEGMRNIEAYARIGAKDNESE